uniref:Putative secreted protein n=1 Tax=Lutzomyia longipalpis TaxID=7200 RepID=A0A7G3ANA8_LUTLO
MVSWCVLFAFFLSAIQTFSQHGEGDIGELERSFSQLYGITSPINRLLADLQIYPSGKLCVSVAPHRHSETISQYCVPMRHPSSHRGKGFG